MVTVTVVGEFAARDRHLRADVAGAVEEASLIAENWGMCRCLRLVREGQAAQEQTLRQGRCLSLSGMGDQVLFPDPRKEPDHRIPF